MKSILLSLVMPPTGFVTLIIIGLLLHGSWYRFGRRLAGAATIGLLLLSLPVVSNTLLRALETGLPTTLPAGHPPQAIVVLGAEVRNNRRDPIGAQAGLLTLERLRTAAALQRKTGLPVLVTGGITESDAAAVGVVMQHTLQNDFNVPVRWVEARSLDTRENALFSADILRAEGIASVYVVTNAWHMRRALVAFEATGLTITAAPTIPEGMAQPDFEGFLPHTSAWQTAYLALHEWIGLIWYRLR
nr:YdcF family protein [uncultured Rhodopila sp.]